ncbi:MAG: hypothetical protein DSY50_02645 [Desulfobulbus sp.]|nr:MAG: hypothetical protein DSY50_02645 [Desulfobulbus sp.]
MPGKKLLLREAELVPEHRNEAQAGKPHVKKTVRTLQEPAFVLNPAVQPAAYQQAVQEAP